MICWLCTSIPYYLLNEHRRCIQVQAEYIGGVIRWGDDMGTGDTALIDSVYFETFN